MEDSPEARSQLVAEKCVSLGQGMRRIVAGNAGLMTGPGTNTYLFGMREVAVLDPGPDDTRHLEAILEAAGPAIRWIIVTHTHPDHSPLASRLARLTGAQVIGLPPPGDGRQDATFAPQRMPVDGERLSAGECELIAIHTPGHRFDHHSYYLEHQRILFAGDMISGITTNVIAPPDGDMFDYMKSLQRLQAVDIAEIVPGLGN